jgi:4-amino-4-deoxy-L-arabinose transferase-like glycosyltransferase
MHPSPSETGTASQPQADSASVSSPPALVLALLFFLWVFATAWIRPLGMPDEGRYTSVAWEMARSGQWLTPTLDGLPYFHKPPMFYWLTGISIKLFGTVEWALRVAPALGATLLAFAGFRLLARWTERRIAIAYVLVLGTMPIIYGGAQYANHDMLVAGFIGGAIAFAADALLSFDHGKPWKSAMLLAWACMGLGLLSKGLIGIVLPAGVIFFWMLLRWRWRWLPRLLWLPGPLLFAMIAAPWFVLMQQKFPQFFNYFFIHQHFERFSETGFNNVQPVWFYPAVLLLLTLPWSLMLLARLRMPVADNTRTATRQLLWIWIIVVIGFFSLPASKLIGYVLPVAPPIAMLVAEVISSWRQELANRTLAITATLTGILLVSAIILFGREDSYSSKPLAQAWLAQAAPGEPLVSLGTYRFDMPVYAQLSAPIPVIMNWNDPAIAARDSWPRELADAARFDPDAGAKVLIDIARLPALLCAQPVTWVITSAKGTPALLSTAQQVASNPHYQLLRFDRKQSTLSCGGGQQ